jgi:hypothetical protein
VHLTGNVSKDSLYAELADDTFVFLRKEFEVGTSEMEMSAITRLANTYTKCNQPVQVGMILVVLGVIPGASFANDTGMKAKANRVAALSALNTLHEISLAHRINREVNQSNL